MTTIFHYQMRHGLLLECFTGLEQSGGEVRPSTGIYYVAPMRRGWQVMAYRYADDDREIDHSEFWEWHVCQRLAAYWCTKVGTSYYNLRKRISEHPYGFPRGRVACVDGMYHVYNGGDLSKALGVKRQTIETIFGIKGKAEWTEDDHEHCLVADKEAIRQGLALEVDWDAV